MSKILILKDNYNTFEQYYLKELDQLNNDVTANYYYKSKGMLRKLFTHFGLPFETFWYGKWKKGISQYDIIIVFDSLHSSKMLKYINNHTEGRLVFWHWNPITTQKDIKIYNDTRQICEHWTFDTKDALKYEMKKNNQFYFYQPIETGECENSVFFVGKDKGRYDEILSIADIIEQAGFQADFHIVVDKSKDIKRSRYCQSNFLDYEDVRKYIRKSRAVLEVVQQNQTGITARALEAMFMNRKLITNNKHIKAYEFYSKENIFIIGIDDEADLEVFLKKPFKPIERDALRRYSAEGWIDAFCKE